MAKQSGIIKLKGTIGDISFYKSQDGYLAREKGGVDRSRILNDPNFKRTRENASEFGRAGKAAKLLSMVFRPVLKNISDSRMHSRLIKEMMLVIKTDMENSRGQRNVMDGDLKLLQGFDFNSNASLSGTLYLMNYAIIVRSRGILTVNFDDFVPDSVIVAPSGTTHFRLLSSGAEIDFEQETFKVGQFISSEIEYSASVSAAISLENNIGASSSQNPLFLVLGIEFLQQVNGKYYPLNNGSFNSMQLLLVDTV